MPLNQNSWTILSRRSSMQGRILKKRIKVSSIVSVNTFPIFPRGICSTWVVVLGIFLSASLRRYPSCRITAVDASEPMIGLAGASVTLAGLADRITFRCERFQAVSLVEPADAAVSNSLLHHVPNPLQFWYRLRQLVKPGSPVLVMDLLRPDSPEEAQAIVDRYAAKEPEMLRRDFYNSLLAAFTEDEVAAQLAETESQPLAHRRRR